MMIIASQSGAYFWLECRVLLLVMLNLEYKIDQLNWKFFCVSSENLDEIPRIGLGRIMY